MPTKTKNTKKPVKRKTSSKKEPEPELKLEEAPVPVPVPVPVPAPITELVSEASITEDPVNSQESSEPVNIVTHFESRLDSLLVHLSTLMKHVKDLNCEVKDVKKELSKELKKMDKSKKKRKNTGNRPPSGFAKPTQLSDELCKFMNIEKGTMRARTQVTKFFCEYFKEHNLQDPSYKRNIIPNEPLKLILKLSDSDEVSYFNLQKYLKIHYP